MRATDNVIGIFAADIHLSHKPPVWRSAEPDWYAAMKRPLDEIFEIQKQFDCPVIYAGDIFDRWNSPAELINFAIANLPIGYAIPGQHDLPLHNYEDMKKSAYWTLIQSHVLNYMHPANPTIVEKDVKNHKMLVFGYPFGYGIETIEHRTDDHIYIAVLHEYCWIDGHTYPGAPKENRLARNASKFIDGRWKGYDVVVYGDNHKGFMVEDKNIKTTFLNCGTLMRRKSDEIDYRPQIGLLLDTGKIISHKLDISQDKYLISDKPINEEEKMDLSDFIKELELLGDTALDYEVAMEQYHLSNKTKKAVKIIITKAMEK